MDSSQLKQRKRLRRNDQQEEDDSYVSLPTPAAKNPPPKSDFYGNLADNLLKGASAIRHSAFARQNSNGYRPTRSRPR